MKKIIKRLFLSLFGIFTISIGFLSIASAANSGDHWYSTNQEGRGQNLEEKVQGVKTQGTQNANTTGASILDTIQKAINRVLGMLSFVALILCLWGGFQMLTAGGDDAKVKTGTKILKNAGLGLAVIGLAWLVVSFVFRIVDKVSG